MFFPTLLVTLVIPISFLIVGSENTANSQTIPVHSTPQLSPSPSPSPTPTPIQSGPSPTSRPSPVPISTAKPAPASTSNTSGVKKDFIMKAINDYRKSQGLSEVSADPHTCDFAKIRAKEISEGFNHDGFRSRLDSHNLPYPSYSVVTENISMNSDYKKVVGRWIASSGHAENMRKDTPFVCVESNGKYYAYEGRRP